MLNAMLLTLKYLGMFVMCLYHIISEPNLIRKPCIVYSWAIIINKKARIAAVHVTNRLSQPKLDCISSIEKLWYVIPNVTHFRVFGYV